MIVVDDKVDVDGDDNDAVHVGAGIVVDLGGHFIDGGLDVTARSELFKSHLEFGQTREQELFG